MIIKEAENNFEWFQHIIKAITNEIFENTDYNTIEEFEKQLLDILSKSYKWKKWSEITQNIFSIEKMSKYIQSKEKIAKNFCALYDNEECKNHLSYINNFNEIKLKNYKKHLLQIWKTLKEIETNFKKEICKFDNFENVSDYIYYINKDKLIDFYPEKLKRKLENIWVDEKDINMICTFNNINENNIISYINTILTKYYILYNKENYIFTIRKKIKEENIVEYVGKNVKKEIETKMIILLYIDKSKTIYTKLINPDYLDSDYKRIKDSYGNVFILQKPLLSI